MHHLRILRSSSNVQKSNNTIDMAVLDVLMSLNIERVNSLTPINTSKQLHVRPSDFSRRSSRGANIFERSEEDATLDEYFKNEAREAAISPRQR
ncbi:hypothetical protein H5410_013292 [Solanum commersonii]|uniref:Uncharacterized protein n=1 Tax=Solanum commersonii TaxID=4109 RepID=A0A9J6AV09_SOLCO|nr:hypothetical protein H5410_013292 [Solanum commersonii]